jgi:hypothetical protein
MTAARRAAPMVRTTGEKVLATPGPPTRERDAVLGNVQIVGRGDGTGPTSSPGKGERRWGPTWMTHNLAPNGTGLAEARQERIAEGRSQ